MVTGCILLWRCITGPNFKILALATLPIWWRCCSVPRPIKSYSLARSFLKRRERLNTISEMLWNSLSGSSSSSGCRQRGVTLLCWIIKRNFIRWSFFHFYLFSYHEIKLCQIIFCRRDLPYYDDDGRLLRIYWVSFDGTNFGCFLSAVLWGNT